MSAQQTFGGRYAVLERVGGGGMAEVYRARDDLLGREVAIKVLHERFSKDRSFVERFRREAQSAANLNHPNVVSLYDYGSDDDTYFIVMEYIDGRSLADIISAEGPLLPERAAEIASDVAKALDRAHSGGLVHRDIKPSNIMITNSGQTKVTDFGIARALGGNGEQTMTQTGMVIGTASYLAPEQAQGNPVDGRSDVYALGVVLFEMLTGDPPFTGETPLAIAYKHVRENPDAPSVRNADVPQALDSVTLKALAKNPDNRYASATEMHDDLQRFLSGQKVTATPVLADQTVVAGAATGTQVLRQTEVDDYRDEDERGPRRAGLYVVVALLILGLFGVLAWLLASNLLGGGEPVEVPNVVGDQYEDAVDELEDVGLEAAREDQPSREPEGEVLRQDPEAGEDAETGDTVTLFVSSGRRQVTVPSVVGESLEEATEILEDARLQVGDITYQTAEDAEPGEVLNQFPDAGEEVDIRRRVDLVVARNVVPNVVGETQEDATAILQDAGYEVAVNTEPSEQEAGIVIAQEPEPGTQLAEGEVVTILVSEGPQQEMPDVRGQDGDEAEAQLEEEFGLDVTQVDADPEQCGAVPPGTVCEQDPEPGTPIEPGDDATLFVQPGDAFIGPGSLAGSFGGSFVTWLALLGLF
ncbi:MAG: Stk1 family PASTA domain-containing Ser/Thr kinase [Actinomycetota bacterium]|nr:Stk1 family PASTA domain-containing Ser/Thr kinase [Actinomycetota bacterium]